MLSSGTTTFSEPTTISGACSLFGTAVLIVNANLTLTNGCNHSVAQPSAAANSAELVR